MLFSVHIDEALTPYEEFGDFPTCTEAAAACERIVDRFLFDQEPGLPADQLFDLYQARGPRPQIFGPDPTCRFDPLGYAIHRVGQLAGSGWNEAECAAAGEVIDEDTTLEAAEILARIRALEEPRTFITTAPAGRFQAIVHLVNGSGFRFTRSTLADPVRVEAIAPRQHAAAADQKRTAQILCGCACSLLDPRVALDRAAEEIEAAGESIELAGFGLIKLPESLWRRTQVRQLYLEENWILELPPEIGELDNLETLSLGFNRLRSLPTEIGRLKRLKSLRLDMNALRSLPEEIGGLENLETLVLSGNLFTEVPERILRLPKLKVLILSRNRIRRIPDAIWRLNTLSTLFLDFNRLEEVPLQLGRLIGLRKLRLDHNRIESLAPELGKLANLKDWANQGGQRRLPGPGDLFSFTITGNPLREIAPGLEGEKVIGHLRRKLEARVKSAPWRDVLLGSDVLISMPAQPILSALQGAVPSIRYVAEFPAGRFAASVSELPEKLDAESLDSALEQIGKEIRVPNAERAGRRKLEGVQLPGVEEIVVSGNRVLRVRTHLSERRMYQLQVEGSDDFVFCGEADFFLRSLRLSTVRPSITCLIAPEVDGPAGIQAALQQAFPEMLWEGGESLPDKIRVSGEGTHCTIRVLRDHQPDPFELNITPKTEAARAEHARIRDRAVEALRARILNTI